MAERARLGDVTRALPDRAVSHRYTAALHGFAARLTVEQAAALRRNPRVLSVTPDWIATVYEAPWGLDRIDQRALPLDGSATFDASGGSGVKAYVIDTGVRASHVDFGGRVAAGANFAGGTTGTNDCHGHGTHVAGTVGGATFGVARAVTVVPVRVLDCSGSAPYSWIIAGLDWVIADHTAGQPAVANLSLGGPLDQAINDAIAKTVTDGVVVVAAAGNSNADACGYSPGSATAALTVGATDGTDRRASFSNTGSCLDLFAPGVGVVSAGIASDSSSAMLSGTSMAAPHVAGIAAVLYGRHPTTDPSTIAKAILDESTSGVVADPAGSANRLAYLGLLVAGPQRIYLNLPQLYAGEPATTLRGVSTSGRAVSYASLTPGTCSIAGSSLTPLAKGVCTVRATTAAGDGWLATQLDTSTNVFVARQSINLATTWAEFSWGATSAPGAVATSGLTVSYASYSQVCAVVGATLQGHYVGDCPVIARQPGNDTYGPAPPVAFWRSVHPARQSLSAPASPTVPVGGSIAYAGSSSAGLPVDVHSASLAICSTSPGLLAGIAAGDCHLRMTQLGSEGVGASGAASLRAVSSITPWRTRLALREDGRAVIAYSAGGNLYLLQCGDSTCSSRTEGQLVDLAERYRKRPEAPYLAIDDLGATVVAGRPVIAYAESVVRPKPGQAYDDWDTVLRVLACDDADCATWTDTVVDDPDPLADIQVVSVSIATVGDLPVIAYGGHNFGLRFLACADLGCTSATRRDIASAFGTDYGSNPSLAAGPDGLPVIGYIRREIAEDGSGAPWGTAVIARCLDATCGSVNRRAVGPAHAGFKPAVVVPADNRPVLFWTDNDMPHADYGVINFQVMHARCSDPACGSSIGGILDQTPMLQADGTPATWSARGFDLSAAVGPDGFPRAAYVAQTRYQTSFAGHPPYPVSVAVVAACSNADCSSARRGYLDEWSRTAGLLQFSSQIPIATGSDGTLRAAFGFFPGSYASEDPLAVGVKHATCTRAVCGTEARAVVAVMDRLTVSKAGTGGGTVSSSPAGISCGATCSALFARGTAVTLTASPASGSKFVGWSGGGCSGGGTCAFSLGAATAVTATFAEAVPPHATLTSPASPTRATTLTYGIVFSEAITGFSTSDLTRTGTAIGCTVGSPSGSGTSFTVSVTGCSEGSVSLGLKAGAVVDASVNAGPIAAVTASTVTIDRSAPTVTSPAARPRLGARLSGSALPARVTWAGRDVGAAGIARYELARSRDGGTTWTTLSSSLSGPQADVLLASSGSSRFRVRAVDRAGNVGAWVAGPTLKPRLKQEGSTVIRYGGTWTRTYSSSFSGGYVRYAKAAGAWAKYTFSGRAAALVTTMGPKRGAVKVYIDGGYVTTVNLYSATTRHRVLAWQRTWSSYGTHTIKLVVVGTSGRPRVDVDAFAIIR